jgi:succinoglycan biosynthesis protein ExoA
MEADEMTLQRDDTSSNSAARVLAVIPCLNEEEHIESVVTKLLAGAERLNLRIIIADGGSTDDSRAIIKRLAGHDRRIVPMDNPLRIQAVGINAAVQKYGDGAQFLVRVDAHAGYPERYCEHLVKVQARTQADSVVISLHTEGHTCFQRAAAAAQNSVLGNGGSAHRNETGGHWVDHGHHALMTIDAFRAVGGYDETFSHNEDAELDARLTAEGFHIYLTGGAQVTYYPRGSAVALFWQYFNIGHGRARNFLKHRKNTKVRHLVLAVVAPAVCLVVLAPFSGMFALPALAWALLCLGYGVLLGVRQRDACAAGAGVAAMAMQAGWSFGFFRGLITGLLKSDPAILPAAREKATAQDRITR